MKVSQVKSGIGCTQDRACAADCHAFAGISLGGRKGSTNCGACRVSRCTELQNLAGRISGGSYTNFQSMQDCWQHKIGSAVAVFFIQVLNRSKAGNPTCSLVTFSSVILGLVKLQFVAAVPHSKSKQLRSLARKLNGNI